MNKTKKTESIAALQAWFATAEAILLTDTSGVDVNTINQLRSKCRAEGVQFRVVKNTLARLALKGTSKEKLGASFVGPTAVALKPGDPVTPAKLVVDFEKDCKSFEIKGGFLDGKLLNAQDVVALSKMQSLPELRAQLLSIFRAPQSRFVGVCSTMVTQVLGVMKARADALEDAA